MCAAPDNSFNRSANSVAFMRETCIISAIHRARSIRALSGQPVSNNMTSRRSKVRLYRSPSVLIAILFLIICPIIGSAQSLNDKVNAGLDALQQGRPSDAQKILTAALKEAEARELQDETMLSILDGLGAAYLNQNKAVDAEQYFRRGLSIREKVSGANHLDLVYSLNNLASLYATQAKYSEAEQLFLRSLTIMQNSSGVDASMVTGSLNGLGGVYYDQGKYDQAEPLLKQSLAIREKYLGAEDSSVATSLLGLASLYRKQERYKEAEPLYRRALSIGEKTFGPTHPGVATILDHYAMLLRSTHRDAEAEKLESRAKEIRRK